MPHNTKQHNTAQNSAGLAMEIIVPQSTRLHHHIARTHRAFDQTSISVTSNVQTDATVSHTSKCHMPGLRGFFWYMFPMITQRSLSMFWRASFTFCIMKAVLSKLSELTCFRDLYIQDCYYDRAACQTGYKLWLFCAFRVHSSACHNSSRFWDSYSG